MNCDKICFQNKTVSWLLSSHNCLRALEVINVHHCLFWGNSLVKSKTWVIPTRPPAETQKSQRNKSMLEFTPPHPKGFG
jgi:hypothetical protein